MTTINQNKLILVKKLYYRDLSSCQNIAKKLNVSLDAVYYFFRKNNLVRRTAKENNLLQFVRQKPTFRIKTKLSSKEKNLKTAGIMLYWGEGSKWTGESIVDFTTSNPAMIKIFLLFLRKICGIDEKKLRVYLYCYQNQNVQELINYWSKITNISKKYFTKPYVSHNFQKKKIGKMQYGLIHVRYCDKKLFLLIMHWLNEFIEKNK